MKTKILTAIVTLGLMFNAKAQSPTSFDRINLGGNINVLIVPSDSINIKIEGDNETVSKVKTEISSDGILTITTEAGIKTSDKSKVVVRAPKIHAIELNGNGNIKNEGVLETDKIDLVTKSIGSMDLKVKAQEVNASLSSIGEIKLAGETDVFNTNLTGVGSIEASKLEAKKVKASISGAGSAKVYAKEKLEANVSGIGSVVYKGDPTDKIIEVSGLGSVSASGNKETVDGKKDKTTFNLFDKEITIGDENGDDDVTQFDFGTTSKKKEKVYDAGDFKHWRGFGIGVNGFVTPTGSLDAPKGYNFLQLDYAKSISFNWNIMERHIQLNKNNHKANILWGLGFEWNNYELKNNYRLRTTNDVPYLSTIELPITAQFDSTNNFSKNKLKTVYAKVPLMLEFNTSNTPKHNFHIAAGVIGGYLLGSKTKRVYDDKGDKQKEVVKNGYYIAPLRAEAALRVGYNNYTLFANYSLTSMFEEARGPQLNPVTVGLHLSF